MITSALSKILNLLAKSQYILPKLILTKITGYLAKIKNKYFKNLFIYIFTQVYKIDLNQAERKNISDYQDFNDFFTRKLDFTVRKLDLSPNIISPVDGTVLTLGDMYNSTLIQAKNHSYQLNELLGESNKSQKFTPLFQNGSFITIYLSPQDYHRVHMPHTGKLVSMRHVPGKLFSVSPTSCKAINNIFANNERVINIFKTEHGYIAVILVGAMLVGSIATQWSGIITPPHNNPSITNFDYSEQEIILNKGDELGYFAMGSTVILLSSEKQNFNQSLIGKHILLSDSLIN